MKKKKMYVFRYDSGYGDGLVFTDDPDDLTRFSKYTDFILLGVFDFPLDFLVALGYDVNNEFNTLEVFYAE